MNGYGGSWRTDYPNADINLSVRLSELTKISVSKSGSGSPNHLLVRPSGDELFQCPLVIMSAPGSAAIDEAEAQRLREYLLKGGMLWTDDSWGSYQWQHWVSELRKILPPAEYPIFDVPLDHALFKTQFEVTEIPQIPNIGFFLRSGGRTSEQGGQRSAASQSRCRSNRPADGADDAQHRHRRLWEREGEDASYFYAFSPRGYAFGINGPVRADALNQRIVGRALPTAAAAAGSEVPAYARPLFPPAPAALGDDTAPAPPPAVARPSVARSAFESASVLCGVILSGSTRTIRYVM